MNRKSLDQNRSITATSRLPISAETSEPGSAGHFCADKRFTRMVSFRPGQSADLYGRKYRESLFCSSRAVGGFAFSGTGILPVGPPGVSPGDSPRRKSTLRTGKRLQVGLFEWRNQPAFNPTRSIESAPP